jgi:PAS domain S-box-containing protein
MEASADFRRVFEVSAEPQLLLAGGAVVICVTDGYLRAAGVSRAQVVGQSLFQVPPYARLDEATKGLLQDELDKAWRSGLQFPHPSRGGTASSLSVPVLDDAGAVQQIVHTLRPVTRPSEASESDSERRLRKLIEYTYDGIVLLDQSGKPFYASPSIERVRGFTVDELMNSSLLDLVHPEDLPRFGQAVKELLGQPGGVMVIQYRARHRDGHWQILETAAVNRLDDPDVLAIVATSRDVSERVTLQDELRTRNEELQVVLKAAKAIGWDRDMLSEQPTRYSTDPAVFCRSMLPPPVRMLMP